MLTFEKFWFKVRTFVTLYYSKYSIVNFMQFVNVKEKCIVPMSYAFRCEICFIQSIHTFILEGMV